MLIVVLVLAIVGLAVLAAAILFGNTVLALIVVVLAAVGLLLLARDWFRDRHRGPAEATEEADVEHHESDEPDVEHHESDQPDVEHHESDEPEVSRGKRALEPDLFEPDVSYEDAEDAEHRGAGRGTDD